MIPTHPGRRPRDQLAGAFLIALMGVGSLVLWIGVPGACLWASSKLTDSFTGHFVIALPMTLAGMVLWALGLFWLNGLYLRVAGLRDEPEDEDDQPRRLRGPLEPLLIGSLVAALVALFIWFFVFAANPSVQVI